MQNLDILNYVDTVMSRVDIPNEYKVSLENKLIRSIFVAAEGIDGKEIEKNLISPEKLASELTAEYLKKSSVSRYSNSDDNRIPSGDDYQHHKPRYRRYCGEYTREQSNIGIKVLYIPLIQITSGMERMTMPLTDDEC